MKIKINDQETYEVGIDDREYTIQEFVLLLERLVKVSQALTEGQDKIIGSSGNIKKVGRPLKTSSSLKCIYCSSVSLVKDGQSKGKDGQRHQRYHCRNCGKKFTDIPKKVRAYKKKRASIVKWKDRDEVVEALKIHYHGTKEAKIDFAKIKNAPDWVHIMKSVHNLRNRYNIQPYEIGLERFPTRNERTVTKTQVPEAKLPNLPDTPRPPLELKRKSDSETQEDDFNLEEELV